MSDAMDGAIVSKLFSARCMGKLLVLATRGDASMFGVIVESRWSKSLCDSHDCESVAVGVCADMVRRMRGLK